MDSTLTRAFDLSALAGKPVALNFAAWYQLEQDYDYGYLAVSDDGGANWKTVPTTTSTTTNPNGGNYGNGMTGDQRRRRDAAMGQRVGGFEPMGGQEDSAALRVDHR